MMAPKKIESGTDLAYFKMSEADYNADPDALRESIIDVLNRGVAGADTQRWLADLFAENGRSYYRVDFRQREPGNPVDRRQSNETFFALYDIWREIENKRSFGRIAAEKTGLHPNTIAKYRQMIVKAEKASN